MIYFPLPISQIPEIIVQSLMMEVEASIFASIEGIQGGKVTFKSANAIFNFPVNPADIERLKVGDKVVLKISRQGKDQTFVSIEPLKTSSQEGGSVKQSPVYNSVVKELEQIGVKPTAENVRIVLDRSAGGSDYPARIAAEFILKTVGIPEEEDVKVLKPAFESQVVPVKTLQKNPEASLHAREIPQQVAQLINAAVASILEEILPPEELVRIQSGNVDKQVETETLYQPGGKVDKQVETETHSHLRGKVDKQVDRETLYRLLGKVDKQVETETLHSLRGKVDKEVETETVPGQTVKPPHGKGEARLVNGPQDLLAKSRALKTKLEATMAAAEHHQEQLLIGKRELAVRIVNTIASDAGLSERLFHTLVRVGNWQADVIFKVKKNGGKKKRGTQLSLQLNSATLGTILVALLLDATVLTCRIYIQGEKALAHLKKHEKILQRRLKAAGYNAQVAFMKREQRTEASEIFPEPVGGLDIVA